VVDVDSLKFQGKTIMVEELPKTLEAVADRENTVLELAYASDQVTMGWFSQVQSQIDNDAEKRKLGFKYLSLIGQQEAGSMGSPDRPAAPPLLPQAPVSELKHVVPFRIGATEFQGGDSITITEVRGTSETIQVGDTYQVKGTYHLASRPHATLALSVSAIRPEDSVGFWASNQSMTIDCGDGDFTLYERIACPGYPHVSLYAGRNSIGGVYFGTGETILRH
jgi:hypothetical protein